MHPQISSHLEGKTESLHDLYYFEHLHDVHNVPDVHVNQDLEDLQYLYFL